MVKVDKVGEHILKAFQKNKTIQKTRHSRGRSLYFVNKHTTCWLNVDKIMEWSALRLNNGLLVGIPKGDDELMIAIDNEDKSFTFDPTVFKCNVVEFFQKHVREIVTHWEDNPFLLNGLALSMRHYSCRIMLLAFLHTVTNLRNDTSESLHNTVCKTTFEVQENDIVNIHRDICYSPSATAYAHVIIDAVNSIEDCLNNLKLPKIPYRIGLHKHEAKNQVSGFFKTCVRVSLQLEFEHRRGSTCETHCVTDYKAAIKELQHIKEQLVH